MTFEKYFLQHVGEKILFKTVSSAWVLATSCGSTKKDKGDFKDCENIIKCPDKINYLIDYFDLTYCYDGETIKNIFNYKLKKYLDR